ncbi:hypothetical protein LIER_10077 [Lithospermum erythrorhizon]|uniref:Uncharacterized protein n=1 Tax=Lithospermum erythrorhizon TaxID=34254 RepID=A0AAV3PMA4_LITER
MINEKKPMFSRIPVIVIKSSSPTPLSMIRSPQATLLCHLRLSSPTKGVRLPFSRETPRTRTSPLVSGSPSMTPLVEHEKFLGEKDKWERISERAVARATKVEEALKKAKAESEALV